MYEGKRKMAREEGRGLGPVWATWELGREGLEALRCVGAPTTTSSAWIPEALARVRMQSGWQKMTRGVMGPIHIK